VVISIRQMAEGTVEVAADIVDPDQYLTVQALSHGYNALRARLVVEQEG
jgi:hypothetical protein